MTEAGKATEKEKLKRRLEKSGDSNDKIQTDLNNIVDLAEVMNDPNKLSRRTTQ